MFKTTALAGLLWSGCRAAVATAVGRHGLRPTPELKPGQGKTQDKSAKPVEQGLKVDPKSVVDVVKGDITGGEAASPTPENFTLAAT